jgi:hypothetical protein
VNTVRIFQLSKGFEVWFWLCPSCLEAKKADGWDVKASVAPPHNLTCDGCREASS